MREVHYTKIFIEGYRSVAEPISFNLDRVGLNLMKGSNGNGKSTIFSALFWCEYGVNLKKTVETWKKYRFEKYRGTRVIIERSIGDYDYRICRHLNFKGTTLGLKGESKLFIFEKHKDEPTFATSHLIDAKYKEDQQAAITEQLGIDSKTFLQSILFGQNLSGLVQSDPKDKRTLFDSLFDVDFVAPALEKAKTRKVAFTNEMNMVIQAIDSEYKSIHKNETLLETLKIQKENFSTDLKKRLRSMEDRLAGLYEKLKERNESLKKAEKEFKGAKVPDEGIKSKYEAKKRLYDEAVDEVTAANRSITSANNQISQSKKMIEGYDDYISKTNIAIENVKTVCPTCKGNLKAADVKEAKDNLKKTITVAEQDKKKEQEVLKQLENNLQEHIQAKETKEALKNILDSDTAVLKEAYDNYAKNLVDYNKLKNAIEPIKNRITEIEEDIAYREEELKKESKKKFDASAISSLEEALEKSKLIISEKEEEKLEKEKLLSKVDWWIKKGFAATGIKSFVFNSMLTKLNVIAQKYAERLGFGVEFTIDMSKETRPFQMLVYKGSEAVDYEDLSGGQQQRVNVCVAFAMHELVASSKTSINILVMDEKFEGLDADGTEAAFELIRTKAETKSVYVITHSHIIDVLNSRSIEVEFENNTTKIYG